MKKMKNKKNPHIEECDCQDPKKTTKVYFLWGLKDNYKTAPNTLPNCPLNNAKHVNGIKITSPHSQAGATPASSFKGSSIHCGLQKAILLFITLLVLLCLAVALSVFVSRIPKSKNSESKAKSEPPSSAKSNKKTDQEVLPSTTQKQNVQKEDEPVVKTFEVTPKKFRNPTKPDDGTNSGPDIKHKFADMAAKYTIFGRYKNRQRRGIKSDFRSASKKVFSHVGGDHSFESKKSISLPKTEDSPDIHPEIHLSLKYRITTKGTGENLNSNCLPPVSLSWTIVCATALAVLTFGTLISLACEALWRSKKCKSQKRRNILIPKDFTRYIDDTDDVEYTFDVPKTRRPLDRNAVKSPGWVFGKTDASHSSTFKSGSYRNSEDCGIMEV